MGAILPRKAPDTSAQMNELKQQRREADAAAATTRKREAEEQAALRRRQRGRVSLIRNLGGELGVTETLGQ